MPQKYYKFIFPFALIFLGLFVGLLNFTPHTYLTGWDTLHPEFDYLLNLKRTIFGVFRTEQGLGAVAAHSHMSEIPRIFMLMFLDIFLPTSLVRFSYIILTLILGPLGIYFFLKNILRKEFKDFNYISFSSFVAAVFYMLNLGTLQQFVVPFEMFNALFAFLPWILLFAIKYIYSRDFEQKKFLLIFAFFTLLGSPMAYAPALWHVHFLMLGMFLMILSLPKLLKKDFSIFKKSIILIFVTLLVNSYWLLPHIYFLLTTSSQVQQALVNKLFSEQAFYYNKEYGNINELALLKSFLFSWSIYGGDNNYLNLLGAYINHLRYIPIQILGYLFALVALIGLIYSIFKKKIIFISFSGVLLLTLFFLFNDNPPFGFLFTFIQNKVPLFKEAFRFPHTKLFIHYIFVFSIFFGVGTVFLANKFGKSKNLFAYLFLIVSTFLIFFFMLPAFRGAYISPQMRINIPSEYFESAKYLNSKSDMGKVALLPINSFWGWDYHDWGYQGAGFNWFNIKQPVLHRNFDRWAWTNEEFYKEMSYAVYSQNTERFEDAIEKYNISYLILDHSLIAPENDPQTLFIPQTEALLKKQNVLEKTKTFGKLDVYELKNNPKDIIYSINNPTSVEPVAQILNEDIAYNMYGEYISDMNEKSAYFPFRQFINNESEISDSLYTISEEGIEFPINSNNSQIKLTNDKLVYADVLVRQNPNSTKTLIISPINNSKSNQSGTLEVPIQGSGEILVNINNSSTFLIPAEIDTGASLLLGKSRLQTDSDNKISFFNPTQSKKSLLKFTSDNFLLRQCDNTLNVDNFGIDFLSDDSFSIFGKNIPLCLTIPFNIVLNTNSNSDSTLFGIKYNSEINNIDAPSYICVINLKNGNCISYFTTDFSTARRNSFYYGLGNQNTDEIGLKFFIDTTKNKTPTKAIFKDLELSTLEPYGSVIIEGSEIREILPEINNASEILTYFSGDQRLSQDITKLPKTVGRCELNPRISVKDKTNSIDLFDDYIRYTTDDGSLCDTFSYQNLLQNQGYIVLITSRNIEGLPLNICLTNFYSKRCDIYTRLTENKIFTTQAFLLPPMSNVDNGYDVNTNNFAVKGTTSINDLKSIIFIPFPYETATSLTTNDTENKSEISKIEFDEINPVLYKTALPKEGSYLTLAFTNEDGWRAYAFKNDNMAMNLLNYSLPFIFGDKLDNKVLVNNWSNGWEVNKPGSYILIVYLPQYLEYVGFVLTIGTFIALLALILRNKNRSG